MNDVDNQDEIRPSLRSIIETAKREHRCSLDDLTVQHPITDPYRADTPAHHAEGKWFAEQVERFVRAGDVVHLRGLHYLIASSDDVTKLNGDRYINSNADWAYLQTISNPARWLGYVPFDRLRDEHSPEIASYVPEEDESYAGLYRGSPVELPDIVDVLFPRFVAHLAIEQPFRIILVSEKSSLASVLEQIARRVGGEMLALTGGDMSHTRLYEIASVRMRDARPTVMHSGYGPDWAAA